MSWIAKWFRAFELDTNTLICFSDTIDFFTQFKVTLGGLFCPDLLLFDILESLRSPLPIKILNGFDFLMLPEFHSIEQIVILVFLIN